MGDLSVICKNLKNHITDVENSIITTNNLCDTIGQLKPKTLLHIIQLRDADFRYNIFQYKETFVKGSVVYREVCSRLRNYIIENGLFLPNGSIKCNEYLRNYVDSDIISFFTLTKLLRLVLQ